MSYSKRKNIRWTSWKSCRKKIPEEKEKEQRDHKKAVKNHKLCDPIIRKKGKDKEFYDNQVKNQKIYKKNTTDFEKLTLT